jgi:hypothetical protein
MKSFTLRYNFYKKSTQELIYGAGEVVSEEELDDILHSMNKGYYICSKPIDLSLLRKNRLEVKELLVE